jgi:hypothetical protein
MAIADAKVAQIGEKWETCGRWENFFGKEV